jgi:LPXTG-site transpeptidase (sortase) family protein
MKEVVVYQAKSKSFGQTSLLKIKQILHISGNFLILVSFLGLIFTFGPLLKSEIIYRVKKESKKIHFGELIKNPPSSSPLSAPDPYFSLVIPKIEARAKILPNIDASNQNEYLSALKKGVAHAKGTVFPGIKGTIFLFAHSTDSPWNITRHNAVFYLLRELEVGDEIIVFFLGKRFNYKVVEKKIVEPNYTDFFSQKEEEILVLQTCWPPGTTKNALLVLAKRFI